MAAPHAILSQPLPIARMGPGCGSPVPRARAALPKANGLRVASSPATTQARIARARPSKGHMTVRAHHTEDPSEGYALEGYSSDPATFSQEVIDDESNYVLQTYGRPGVVFTHGEGSCLYDAFGKKYIDLSAGIAVNCLGHGDAEWMEAVSSMAGKLVHTSNLYHTPPQAALAKRLVTSCFADRIFYCNSGTEANEACIKFARKWARVNAGLDPTVRTDAAPTEIVTFTNSFHGRTVGALSLTCKEVYQIPFEPLMPGVQYATYNDLDSAAKAIVKGKTCAVFVEPVQGEGGVNVAAGKFLAGLRELCDEAGALLVFDEVQCGLGRTGKMWGHQNFGVEPDLMSVAKPLAGGLPIGAVLMKQKVADVMKPGDHGSTFAGAPLVTHAALAVVDKIEAPGFLDSVTAKGEKLRAELASAIGDSPHVKEIRGSGLLCGVEMDVPVGPLVKACLDAGVCVISAGAGNVLRMVPPLVITGEEIEAAVKVIAECMPALDE